MNTTVNKYLFASATFDSASLGVLTSVIHQFSIPGVYRGEVHREGNPAGSFSFEVSESSTETQINIDLSATVGPASKSGCDCGKSVAVLPTVSPTGYVLFYTSVGTGGFSAVVGETGTKGKVLFDSKKLGAGDIFALSLMEPTTYSMRNTLGSAKGRVVVSYSAKYAGRLKNLDSQAVSVSKEKFDPAQVALIATQGLYFQVVDEARIVIERASKPPKDSRPKPPRRFEPLRPKPKR